MGVSKQETEIEYTTFNHLAGFKRNISLGWTSWEQKSLANIYTVENSDGQLKVRSYVTKHTRSVFSFALKAI